MKVLKSVLISLSLFFLISPVWAQGLSNTGYGLGTIAVSKVQTTDGATSCYPATLEVSPGSLTCNNNGSAEVNTGTSIGSSISGSTPLSDLFVNSSNSLDQTPKFVDYVSASALPSNTYYNGPANNGIGATLTGTATGNINVDGQNPQVGTTILVVAESSRTHNGVYTVTTQGALGVAYVLTRSGNAQTPDELLGTTYAILAGTNLGNTLWMNNNFSLTAIGSNNISYSQLTQFTSVIGSPNYINNKTTQPLALNGYSGDGGGQHYQLEDSHAYANGGIFSIYTTGMIVSGYTLVCDYQHTPDTSGTYDLLLNTTGKMNNGYGTMSMYSEGHLGITVGLTGAVTMPQSLTVTGALSTDGALITSDGSGDLTVTNSLYNSNFLGIAGSGVNISGQNGTSGTTGGFADGANLSGGTGGNSTNGVAGTGGAISITGGGSGTATKTSSGNLTNAAAGSIIISSGNGGDANTSNGTGTVTGGAGGNTQINANSGGTTQSTASLITSGNATGGRAGNVIINGFAGGVGQGSSNTNKGGAGTNVTFTGGTGGQGYGGDFAGGTTAIGGAGGGGTFSGGAGGVANGASTTNTGGAGANFTFKPGAGGVGSGAGATNGADGSLIFKDANSNTIATVSDTAFTVNQCSSHAGQASCWATGGVEGYCTTVVGVGGGCTCTAC